MIKFINKNKIRFWVKRYLPAEILCTFTAMISATLAYSLTKNDILTALAGTWGENIGFYAVNVGRDIYVSQKNHKKNNKIYTFESFIENIKNAVLEFGPAEIIDSFLSRPFMMYIFPKITGNVQLGIFAGKIAADIIIYLPIILSYEVQQTIKSRKNKSI
jgi:hypothetical protein